MGLQVLQGGIRWGEAAMDVTDAVTNPYFGGQPSCMQTSGLVRLAKTADADAFVGVYQNASNQDAENGNATVVVPPAIVRFINGSVEEDTTNNAGAVLEGAPYDTSTTFSPSNLLYIGSTGLWENSGTAGTEKGIVTKGNTSADDAVEAIMWGTNLTATS